MVSRASLGIVAASLLFAFAITVYADTGINEVFVQLEQEYQLPTGILAKVANVESGGNPNAGSGSSSAYGLFQWTLNSWYNITKQVYGQALNGEQRANPVTSAKMTAVALRQALTTNSGLMQQAKIDPTLGLYMCHFLGSGGCGKFFQAYIQNPGADATSMFPKEAASNRTVFGGRTLTGVLNFFAQRLKVAGVSVDLVGNFSDANGISMAYSNADVSPANFMPKSFVPPAQDPYRTYQTSYAPTQNQSLQTPSKITSPQITSQLPKTGSGASTSYNAALQSAALLVAQPQRVRHGDPVLVSWSSVGMDPQTLCKVSSDGQVIAQKNSGSQVLQTTLSQVGTLTFALSCTTQAGAQLQQTTTVRVE